LLVPTSVQNSGLIGVDECDGQVEHWGELAGRAPLAGLRPASSTGVYLIEGASWLGWSHSSCPSLERDILPEAVAQRSLGGTVVDTPLPLFDYGTPARLQELHDNQWLRRELLHAARLLPKGDAWIPPSSTSGLRDTSGERLSLVASAAVN
jgi:hypothetical protein